MLTKERIGVISKLALPNGIALSSTMVMGLIDLAMVASLGNDAVAAVGLAVFSYTLIVAFVLGTSSAVQGIVARRRGEGSSEPRSLPLNAGLMVAAIVGIPLSMVAYMATPLLFSMLSSDPKVTEVGVGFLKILYISVFAVGINCAFKGYWNGIERPKIYMSIILLMDCLNILFNYMFIFGNFGAPELGVAGAALGTTLACTVGMIVNIVIAHFHFRKERFWYIKDAFAQVSRVFKLGLPATMQEFFFSAGYITFFWMVGMVGTAELAAANVLVRVTMVLVLLAMSMGVASATLVSKSVGEGDVEGAAQWGWDSGKLGVIGITLLGLPLLLFPEAFLSTFLSDPHTIAIATVPLQLVAATTGIGSLIYIFAYTLYSVGDGNRVMLVSFATQWFVFLPGVWLVGPYLKYGLLEIWLVQMAYGCLATGLITAIWMGGRWKTIEI